jgi:putative sugar O-methyltransferase
VSGQRMTNDADRAVAELIERMRRGLEASAPIYHPGTFWSELIAANLATLESDGIERFKRTISNNYYHWLVTNRRDPQLRVALRNWLRHPTIAPLTNRIEETTGLLTTTHDGSFALTRADSWRYKFFVGAVWDEARRNDPLRLTARLAEPLAGNPIRVWHRGRLVSQDLANSIIELGFVEPLGILREGARVAELGAGYGRLAYVYAQATPLTYCIFDIPPALAVAQWYLTTVLGEARVVPYSPANDFAVVQSRLTPGVIAFFTPDQLETFPDGWFDCCQTISTLPEMPPAQATLYLGLLAAKSSRALFLKQWRKWRNDADGVELTEEQYALAAPWKLASRRVDPVQPAFFNQLWLR